MINNIFLLIFIFGGLLANSQNNSLSNIADSSYYAIRHIQNPNSIKADTILIENYPHFASHIKFEIIIYN